MGKWLKRGAILFVALYPTTVAITIAHFLRHGRIPRNPWKHAHAVESAMLQQLNARVQRFANRNAKPS